MAKPRGTHFFCLNSDIGRQFEFLQQTWANNPQFNGLYDNRDPIIGNNDGTSTMVIPQCPVRRRVKGSAALCCRERGSVFLCAEYAIAHIPHPPLRLSGLR